MKENHYFTLSERLILVSLYRTLLKGLGENLQPNDIRLLKDYLQKAIEAEALPRDNFGLNPVIKDIQTSLIVVDEMGMRRASVLAIMLHGCVQRGVLPMS
jgi:GTP pyrophosphokinase